MKLRLALLVALLALTLTTSASWRLSELDRVDR